MVNPVILFKGSVEDVYLIDKIFDPDIHVTDAQASGKVVPAVGSIVIDNRSVPNKYVLWIVDAIVPGTLKTLYKAGQFVTDITDEIGRLISYGNDTMMLYYDDRETTRLIVDSKFVLIGGSCAEYRILSGSGADAIVISARLDNEGTIISNRIPIVETGINGIRKLTDCHTTHTMTEGEFFTLEIFDSSGALTTTVRMISKRSTILNDLIGSQNPIVEFTADASQINGTDWVLYTDQNPDDLAIWPKIIYANGSMEIVPINGMNTFLYGMEDVDTSVAHVQYPLIIKHYLAEDVPTTIAEGNGVRYLRFETNLLIIPRQYSMFSKISVIPYYNDSTSTWELKFCGYYVGRDRFELLPSGNVSFAGASFDGTALGVQQELIMHANIMNEFGDMETYVQNIAIKVDAPDSITPFLIAPSADSVNVYGAETSVYNRPVINYDSIRETYFIPTSSFSDLDEFLLNFYYAATPPHLPEFETEAPIVTHFTLRDKTNGRVLLPIPVSVDVYDQELVLSTIGSPDQYDESTIILEFLIEQSGGYEVIYGVPVEVRPGTYNV